tara:strand:+ start:1641 stop:1955 length:315 start_codon:yes stop_codon:yes gene_type:complete
MHPVLAKEFQNLKVLSDKNNGSLALIETQREDIIFISNGKKLVCLAIKETEIHNVLSCFRVNLEKWQWAEDEGFELENGLPDDLISEILIKFQTPGEYLRYLNL